MDANNLKELTDMLDARYVRKDDCAVKREQTNAEIKEISINQARSNTQLSTITKIDIIILTAVITILVAQIGKLILK